VVPHHRHPVTPHDVCDTSLSQTLYHTTISNQKFSNLDFSSSPTKVRLYGLLIWLLLWHVLSTLNIVSCLCQKSFQLDQYILASKLNLKIFHSSPVHLIQTVRNLSLGLPRIYQAVLVYHIFF
jgi:hypothetical protein